MSWDPFSNTDSKGVSSLCGFSLPTPQASRICECNQERTVRYSDPIDKRTLGLPCISTQIVISIKYHCIFGSSFPRNHSERRFKISVQNKSSSSIERKNQNPVRNNLDYFECILQHALSETLILSLQVSKEHPHPSPILFPTKAYPEAHSCRT